MTYIGVSFLSPNDFPLYGRITFSFIIHWLMEICILFGFYKKNAMIIYVYIFVWLYVFISLGYAVNIYIQVLVWKYVFISLG